MKAADLGHPVWDGKIVDIVSVTLQNISVNYFEPDGLRAEMQIAFNFFAHFDKYSNVLNSIKCHMHQIVMDCICMRLQKEMLKLQVAIKMIILQVTYIFANGC